MLLDIEQAGLRFKAAQADCLAAEARFAAACERHGIPRYAATDLPECTTFLAASNAMQAAFAEYMTGVRAR